MINPFGASFYDFGARSVEARFVPVGESMTVQSQREDADINVIVRRFGVTGVLPVVQMPPLQGDFAEALDFRACQERFLAASSSFMALDADVRYRFHNDPAEFVEFCSDEKNLPEMRKMGIAIPEPVVPVERVVKVEVVSPPVKPEA